MACIVAPEEAHEERGVFFESARREAAGTIEPGMVIALELLYYELGLGGFQIEDTVIVTEQGAERVNELP